MVDEDSDSPDPLNPSLDGFDWEARCPYCDATFQFTAAVDNKFRCPSCDDPIDVHSASPATQE